MRNKEYEYNFTILAAPAAAAPAATAPASAAAAGAQAGVTFFLFF